MWLYKSILLEQPLGQFDPTVFLCHSKRRVIERRVEYWALVPVEEICCLIWDNLKEC